MKHPGKIVITDNKVYFKPNELERPNKEIFYTEGKFNPILYRKSMERWIASKQLIEVNNEYYNYEDNKQKDFIEIGYGLSKGLIEIKDKQSCEAEVENNVATIIKINK